MPWQEKAPWIPNIPMAECDLGQGMCVMCVQAQPLEHSQPSMLPLLQMDVNLLGIALSLAGF